MAEILWGPAQILLQVKLHLLISSYQSSVWYGCARQKARVSPRVSELCKLTTAGHGATTSSPTDLLQETMEKVKNNTALFCRMTHRYCHRRDETKRKVPGCHVFYRGSSSLAQLLENAWKVGDNLVWSKIWVKIASLPIYLNIWQQVLRNVSSCCNVITFINPDFVLDKLSRDDSCMKWSMQIIPAFAESQNTNDFHHSLVTWLCLSYIYCFGLVDCVLHCTKSPTCHTLRALWLWMFTSLSYIDLALAERCYFKSEFMCVEEISMTTIASMQWGLCIWEYGLVLPVAEWSLEGRSQRAKRRGKFKF